MSVIETVKRHPYMTAGAIGGGVLLLFIVSRGGGGGGDTVYGDDGAAAQTDIAAILAGVNQRAMEVEAGKIVALGDQATRIDIAKITADHTESVALLQHNVMLADIGARETVALEQWKTQQNQNSLQAATQQAQIKAQADVSIATTQTLANSLVEMAKTNAAGAVGVAQASRPCSSYLFGLIQDC